ncbi:hypothetical protein H4R18_005538 [Coemansia javaensis]|uniref:Arrestin-like N-terminal domain-containing protein n=1 Tax=Coemansia javaensis TaxID=2761396 RepID=A0A9W8H4T2_9FUNG|nr:hypothetical protein H4R18_005538 [Coemansia javaensis]
MKWSGAASKPEVTVHPYSSQIIVTNGANTNLIPGYVYVTVARPTLVKSIDVSFGGIYSVRLITGSGPSREEFFQHRMFHCERTRLAARDLVSSTAPARLFGGPTALRGEDRGSGWEEISYYGGCSDSDDEPPTYAEPTDAVVPDTDRALPGTDARANSFVLPAGTHRFDFVFVVPPRMPSTIVSHMGGIEYKLSACVKTKGHIGLPLSVRTECPVHIVNIPARLITMQTSLPANDEAMFTRQIEDSWWILVKVASCTVFPSDTLQLSVCMSWPGMCEYDEDVDRYLELSSVQMDLCECTVHKSMITGEIIKEDTTTIASSLNGDSDLLGNASRNPSPPSYDLIRTDSCSLRPKAAGSEYSSSEDLVGDAAYEEGTRGQAGSRPSESAVRGMFNEDQARQFQLQIPQQRDMGAHHKTATGIHIDCRSTPISIGHRLQVTLQILDRVSRKLHVVPFHCRIVAIPEAESFILPAYTLSLQDTRVQ